MPFPSEQSFFVDSVVGGSERVGVELLASTRIKAAEHPDWLGVVATTFAVVAAVGLVGTSSGCETTPVRALRGARHYAAGNDALDRGDSVRAIEELEQAAVLVPHASEIQNHLGLAYWSGGELKAARQSFERALELNCENQAAAANLEILRTSSGVPLGPQITRDARLRRPDGGGVRVRGEVEAGSGGNADGG